MKDIAADLGVSLSLVSKVLGNRLGTSGVSPRMQKRIQKKASELGYVRNRNSIGLITGKKGTIGLFFIPWGEPGTDLTYEFLNGVTDTLRPSFYHLWLNFVNEGREFYRQMILQEIKQRIDGLIVGGCSVSWLLPHLRQIDKAGIPIITCLQDPFPHIANIGVDYYLQSRLPTEHLLSRGCRKIVHFHLFKSRYDGYADAIRAAGLSVQPRYVIRPADFGIEHARVAMRKLLKSKVPFDGIVAQSDQQALGAILELSAHGIRVPEQVRVTGVDNSPACSLSPVPITSVTHESFLIGKLAAGAMIKKIAREPVESVILPPKLVVRASG